MSDTEECAWHFSALQKDFSLVEYVMDLEWVLFTSEDSCLFLWLSMIDIKASNGLEIVRINLNDLIIA